MSQSKIQLRQAQRGNVLEKLSFMEGCYLLSVDGTEYFSSTKVHCSACLEKKNSKTGEIRYSHQMVAAAIVHPDLKEVIPVFPEPIENQDGTSKNDCERNASKRFLEKFRKAHPHLGVIVLEDGISSNAPILRNYANTPCIVFWASSPATMSLYSSRLKRPFAMETS